MKEKACPVCFENCVRLHGEEGNAEISPTADSSGPGSHPVPKADGASGSLQKETGKESMSTELYPSFLKKMTDLTITTPLQLPASFVKTSIAKLGAASFVKNSKHGAAVTLEGPGKGTWEVEIGLGKENHSLEFRNGWQKFVGDHFLQIGDQLSFTLVAGSYFQVMVYDESGSQKVSAADAKNVPNELIAIGVPVGSAAQVRPKPVSRPKQKVRRKPKAESSEKPVVELEPPVVQSSESELRNSNSPGTGNKFKETPVSGNKFKETPVSGNKFKETPVSGNKFKETPVSGNKFKETPVNGNKSKETVSEEMMSEDDADDESNLPLLPPLVILDGAVVSRRRAVSTEEKERAFNAANALQTTNPKLVVVMSKGLCCRGFWMCLSRSFAKAYMPHETREVILLNKAGNQWPVKWLYKDSGSGFSGGWRGFSLDHRLEEHDVCVLEVLDQDNFIILVHIFRVIGAPKEDAGNYRPTPGRARNANSSQNKRKMASDAFEAGPSSSKKVLNYGNHERQTPPKLELPSCSKRAPNHSKNAVAHSSCSDPGFDETHMGKEVKSPPTISSEVYAEYTSFNIPLLQDGQGADLDVRPLDTKQAAAADDTEAPRETLLKLGKELVGHGQQTDASPSSHGDEQMQSENNVLLKTNGNEGKLLVA